MLNMSAALFGFVVYIRYLQVKEYQVSFNMPQFRIFNNICLITGVLAAFGMSIVANFQETNVLTMHLIGAFVAFISPIFYMISDIYMAFKSSGVIVPKWMPFARVVVCIIYSSSFILTTLFSQLAYNEFDADDGHTMQFWQPEDGGWDLHVVSTVFEWILGINIILYLVSFYNEFHQSHLCPPRVKLGPGLVSKSSEPNLSGMDMNANDSDYHTSQGQVKRTLRIEA